MPTAPDDADFERIYLSGQRLWGDDFTADQRAAWFDDEREGYANLDGSVTEALVDGSHPYQFHGINEFHGFSRLPQGRLGDGLGLGSAYGDEFLPIIDRLDSVTIVEPSHQLRSERLGSLVPRYVDAQPSGDLAFDAATFDIVLCFGVLHHIPNVTHVIDELARVTRPGGWLLIREPVTSMGDWRQPRHGLTARERGIPRPLIERAMREAGLVIERRAWFDFPTTRRAARLSPAFGYGSGLGARVDHALATVTSVNHRYHARSAWQKVRPISTFYVLRKR